MLKLEDIGFLEVIESRAKNISAGSISYCEWIVTTNCNFNCPYCNRLENKPVNNPDFSKVEFIVNQLTKMNCKYVHLTGGEPTTRKDLIDIVRLLKNNNIRVGLSTNSSRSLEYYKSLVDAGVELISMSLDVHQKDLNKKFTMISDNIFDVVVSNIKELSKLIYVNVGVVFNDDNIDFYNEILEFISNLGAKDIRIMTSTKYNKIVNFDVNKDLLEKHPILKFRINNFNDGLNMRGSDLAQTDKCHLVKDDITIFGDYFYPCAIYVREKGNPIGKFDEYNEEKRYAWFEKHNSHKDELCKKFCMDFKCRFNDKVDLFCKENIC